MRQVLAWAMEHDAAMALRLAVALAPWWFLRGRAPGGYPLLREAAGRAELGSEVWCAAQFWLGRTALDAPRSGRGAGPLHRGPRRHRGPGAVPGAGRLPGAAGRCVLSNLGRIAEAADDGRRSLALARELGYPAGEALALVGPRASPPMYAGDLDGAVQLARQAEQIPADIPGWIARAAQQLLDRGADRGRGPGRRRACLRGGAGPVPGGGRPAEPGGPADPRWRSWTCGRAASRTPRRTCGKHSRSPRGPAAGSSCSTSWTAAGTCAPRPGAAPRPSRSGPRAPRSCGTRGTRSAPADARRRQEPLREARQALGPARARAAEERGAAMSLATAAEYALMLTAPEPQPAAGAAGTGAAQRPGTGAGHPGRPGPHRRPDRRPAVHQHPHRPLPPGPDPGQDRLPAPRRPDPPGPQRGPGLAGPGPPGSGVRSACG